MKNAVSFIFISAPFSDRHLNHSSNRVGTFSSELSSLAWFVGVVEKKNMRVLLFTALLAAFLIQVFIPLFPPSFLLFFSLTFQKKKLTKKKQQNKTKKKQKTKNKTKQNKKQTNKTKNKQTKKKRMLPPGEHQGTPSSLNSVTTC